MAKSANSLYHLSTDYEKLFRLICEGQSIAAWSDTYSMKDGDGNPYRDICEVLRTGEYEIMISARGTSYGNVWPFMKDEGTEQEVFIRACRGCNLAWIDPTPEVIGGSFND